MYDLLYFWRDCLRVSSTRSWNAANGLLGSLVGVVGTAFVPLDILSDYPRLKSVVTFVIYALSAYIGLLLVEFFFIAPFRAWKRKDRGVLNLREGLRRK